MSFPATPIPGALRHTIFAFALLLSAGGMLTCAGARAQDKPAWFVPAAPAAGARPAAAGAGPRTRRSAPEPAPTQADDAVGQPDQGGDTQQEQQAEAIPRYSLPALAPLPALPKTATPPGALIGVLGVPDVMRASTAAQLVQKVIGARHDKLQQDYQKEEQVWRDLQQALVNQRGTLSQDQLQIREKQLQERVAGEVKAFRARDRVVQEANQVSVAQVERVLVAVIRQVAESRGMNLVLHREQVALNTSDFDITDQVAAQLNSLLPTVTIPPDGQDPTPANTGGALVAGAAASTPGPVAASP